LRSRWLIIIPAVLFALFAKPAKADVLGEWTYSESISCNGSVEVINNTITLHGPDGCPGANWVKIETTIPADVDTIDFLWSYQTDDGAHFDPPQIGVNEVYTQLTDQNYATGSGSISVQEGDIFTFRQYSVDSCCQPGHLTISNLSLWESITSSTTSTTTTTTTSTVPETTVPVTNPTTTTVQETTTTSSTTVPETTTSVENSTSTTSTTTTSTSTTSSLPQTTTTESTTTTTQPPPTPPPTPPQTTQPAPVETSVPTTLPEPSTTTTSTTIEATTTTVPPPSTTTTTVQPTTTTSVPPTTTIAPESPQTTLPAVLSDVTPTQALTVALATETLQTLSASQATEIFASLPTETLSDTQIADITEAVQDAPTEVRESFEEEVDVFKAGFDDYVPLGSTIPVGERRTLIAVTAGITLAAAGTRIRR